MRETHMTNSGPAQRTRKWPAVLGGGAAIVACGACCAGPLLAASGVLAAISAVAAIWVPSLIALAVVASVAGLLIYRGRHAADRCAVEGPVDLGVPGVPESDTPGPVNDVSEVRGVRG
jgi:hypothetical protein